MVGFRKEVNREENLEVIPVGQAAATSSCASSLERDGSVLQRVAAAAGVGGHDRNADTNPRARRHHPARWDQAGADARVRGQLSSTPVPQRWYTDVIDATVNAEQHSAA